MTDSIAVTRPPGLRRQVASPLASTTRSRGRRFAATTRSNVGVATVTLYQLLSGGWAQPTATCAESVFCLPSAGDRPRAGATVMSCACLLYTSPEPTRQAEISYAV